MCFVCRVVLSWQNVGRLFKIINETARFVCLGEEWLRNRNSINPAISLPKIVKKFRSAQREIAKDLVKFIQEKRDEATGEVEDFDHVLNSWALESIAVLLLDTR